MIASTEGEHHPFLLAESKESGFQGVPIAQDDLPRRRFELNSHTNFSPHGVFSDQDGASEMVALPTDRQQ